ncbi:excisionase [Candidatus Peregrinibacteria bacterium CG_4_10_14_0_2_um_filter_43_11]|nr:MAG: excisionase [Candidatus Peregrinibacteria bacterium CG_4_10_14_0_2_um_filter_43_11]
MLTLLGKIYTTEQVASLLQIHPLTVLKYIKEGRLKAVKLGRVYRVQEALIQQFLENESL